MVWYGCWSHAGLCTLTLLFNIMLEVVIALALEDNEIGVNISGINISNLHFADDICLAAGSNNAASRQRLYNQ